MKFDAKVLFGRLLSICKREAPLKPGVNPEANPLYAHRCCAGQFQRWYPVSEAAKEREIGRLVEGVFQPPGFVCVDDSVFDLTAEGVYRFYRLARLSEQRIVWRGKLDTLLSMLGHLWVYGSINDPTERSAALVAIRQQVIAGTCFRLAAVAVTLLAEVGVSARLVALMTLESWGGQDDRHTLVEVKPAGSDWFLYDPSFNVCFSENGRRLSLVDAVKSLKHGTVTLERLSNMVGRGPFGSRRPGHSFWLDELVGSNEILYDWYRRLAGVPLVHDNGVDAFAKNGLTVKDCERFSRRYRMMSHDEFITRYYDRPETRSSTDDVADVGRD